jgi:uncharacterized membrane protein YbhN (UPF0104 family)
MLNAAPPHVTSQGAAPQAALASTGERSNAAARRRANVWTVLKIALALALVALVASRTSPAELAALRYRVSLPWLAGGLAAFLACIGAMAWRYWLLIGRQISFRQTLRLVVVQTVVGNLVATSAGAVSYVALLRGQHRVQVGSGLASLLWARFGDLLALLGALALSAWALWGPIAPLRWLVMGLLVAGLLGVMALMLALIYRRPLIRLARWTHARLRLDRLPIIARGSAALTGLDHLEVRQWLAALRPAAMGTALVFALTFVYSYCNVRTFGLPISGWAVLFVLALTQFMVLIPVQVFGGLGVYEVTSLYLYTLLGAGQTEMASALIGMRLVFYGANLVAWLYLLLDDHRK